ncbi:MAG: hypothetical protein IJC19_02935 [Clostridia bacterium]|nr:hypothetical protein [Clostridia bacterium]
MLKRILTFLLFGVLLFSFVGCGTVEDITSSDDTPTSSGKDTDTNISDNSQEILQNGGPFKFSYEIDQVVWERNEGAGMLDMTALIEYLGEEVYVSENGFESYDANFLIYHNADDRTTYSESSYYIPFEVGTNWQTEYEIQPGAVGRTIIKDLLIPKDAPLGKYHIKLSFEGYYQIFENAIEIVE